MIHFKWNCSSSTSFIRSILFFLLLLWVYPFSFGQQIITDQVFGVKGYSLFEIGFPSRVVPSGRGQFAFLEYWSQGEGEGTQKRLTENYYLQCYGIRSFVEHWFVPVTEEGQETMQVKELVNLENSCGVFGEQFRSEVNRVCTVGRFFDLDGQALTEKPIIISSFGRSVNRKQYQETFTASTQGKCILWAAINNNKCFMSAWTSKGDSIWIKELDVDLPKSGYGIKEIQVDDSANVYMLWTKKIPTYSMKDKDTPPVVVRYLHNSDMLLSQNIETTQGIPRLTDMKLQGNSNELVIAGIIANPASQVGFANGISIKKQEVEKYAHVFLQRWNSRTFETTRETLEDMPERWENAYKEEGANFNHSELILNRDYAVFLLEERFTKKKNMYYLDIGCLSFDLKKNNLIWNEIVDKRQIDKESNRFLSYSVGIARDRLRLVYLNKMGAMGDLLCTSLELATGKRKDRMLASNEEARYLFFTDRSGMVSTLEMVLLGLGNPGQNDFKLVTVSF